MAGINSSEAVLAPTVTADGTPASRVPQRITGAGSQANATALAVGSFASLMAATDLRFRTGATAPTAVTTDVYLPAGGRFDWTVDSDTCFVAVIHPSGGTVEAHVFSSSYVPA